MKSPLSRNNFSKCTFLSYICNVPGCGKELEVETREQQGGAKVRTIKQMWSIRVEVIDHISQ